MLNLFFKDEYNPRAEGLELVTGATLAPQSYIIINRYIFNKSGNYMYVPFAIKNKI